MGIDWGEVAASGHPVPDGGTLTDLTAELTALLGTTDAAGEDIAVATLTAWLRRGVYDDLLPGLGDGMTIGLGAAAAGRRGASAAVLAACLDRSSGRMTDQQALAWGDRIVDWWLTETDDAALCHGSEALCALARHPACGAGELAVVLDVIAEGARGVTHEPTADRLALATLEVLQRGLVPVGELETWLARIDAESATYLRSLHLHLSLAPSAPRERADVLLLIIGRLRDIHPALRLR